MASEKKKKEREKQEASGIKMIATNRKARFEYELMEKFEAGLVLLGPEVKSLREARVSIQESYARTRSGEVFVHNLDIQPYKYATLSAPEPKRIRKLLLNRREIAKIETKLNERGLTLIPMSLYFKKGRAKLEIAIAKGRKSHDKRHAIQKREMDRELRQRGLR